MRFPRPLFRVDNSPLREAASEGTPLDLSRATKLRHVEFVYESPRVQWIIATLRTAKTKTLQSISLAISYRAIIRAFHIEAIRQEWSSLDQLLVQIWTLHSLRPKLSHDRVVNLEIQSAKIILGKLLPESTRRGIVDLVEDHPVHWSWAVRL